MSSSSYRRLVGAARASAIGDGMLFAALPLLSAALLDDAFQVSVVTAAMTVPWLLFGLPAGAYADRFERQRLMVIADLLRAMTLLTGAALLAGGWLTFWPLVAVGFLLGVGEVLFDCSSAALLPTIVRRGKLVAANGRLFAVQTVGRDFVGHALGGVLFAAGRAVPLVLDSLSFLISAGLLNGVRGPKPPPYATKPRFAADIREGMSLVMRDPLLRVMTATAGLVNAVYLGQVAVFVILVRDVLKLPAAAYGVLLTANAAGALLGSAAVSRLNREFGQVPTLIGNLALMGLAGMVVAATDSVYLVVIGYSAAGFALMVLNVVTVSLRQELVPDRLLGRVTGIVRLFSWGTMPAGALVFGALNDISGPRLAFAASGVMILVLSLLVAPALLRDSRTSGDRSRRSSRQITRSGRHRRGALPPSNPASPPATRAG